jgi:hypothetical protein
MAIEDAITERLGDSLTMKWIGKDPVGLCCFRSCLTHIPAELSAQISLGVDRM